MHVHANRTANVYGVVLRQRCVFGWLSMCATSASGIDRTKATSIKMSAHARVRACMQHGMVGHGEAKVWRGVAWRGTAQHGMVWRGVAWGGMVWHGVAWCDAVWRGVACTATRSIRIGHGPWAMGCGHGLWAVTYGT